MEEGECLHIIHELCGDHDAGDEEAVDVKGVDGQGGLAVGEAVEVNVGDDEAGGAAIGVLEDPLEVALDGDAGAGEAVEDGDLLRLKLGGEIVGVGDSLEERREVRYEFGHYTTLQGLHFRHCWLSTTNEKEEFYASYALFD